MVIKSHASELRGYKKSRTHTHTVGKKSHTTLSSIFDSLVTLRLIIHA